MTARLPPIEERLNRRAYQRLLKVPAFWREYCQVQMARQITFSQLVSRALAGIVWLATLAAYPNWLVPQTAFAQGPEGLLAAQSIVATITTLYLASLISSTLHASRTVTVLSHLPITDRKLAWYTYRQHIWPLTAVSYAHICVYLHYIHQVPRLGWQWELAFPMTIGQVLVYWATAFVLVRYIPAFILNSSAIKYAPLSLFAFCWPDVRLSETAVALALFVLPSGWINAILIWADPWNGRVFFWFLVPFILWCAWSLWCLEEILKRYRIREFIMRRGEETAVALVGSPSNLIVVNDEVESDRRLLEESASSAARQRREMVYSRQFVEQEDWSRLGWIEWVVYVCLSERSRIIIETLTSYRISWTAHWWTLMWASSASWLMCKLFAAGPLVWYVQLCLSFMYVVTGFWPAFRLRNLGGMYGAQVYGLPLGLDETFSTFMKVALIRILAATVVWFPIIGMILQQQAKPLEASIPIMIATFVLAVATAVWTAFFQFGLGAEFSDGARKFLWFVCLNVLGLTFIGGTIYTVTSAQIAEFVPRVKEMGVGLSIVMSATTLNWLLFRTIYRNGAVDLVVFQTPYSERHFAAHELAEIEAARKVERRTVRVLSRDQ